MVRALTSQELNYLRSDSQWSQLYLAVLPSQVVATARVNQSVTSYDSLAQIQYDTFSGNLSDILPGMTMWVGTTPGGREKGAVRIRKPPTPTFFFFGEVSDVPFADNDYLTIIDEFRLWPRHLRVNPTRMDYDIQYSNQHLYPAPVPVLGPTTACLWLGESGEATFTPDAAQSWVLGSTITSYLWSAPGASSTSGLSTATPMIKYNAPGVYRVSCQVTGNGTTSTGYRYVFVFSNSSPPITEFTLNSLSGDFHDGGWSFRVTLYDQASLSSIQDRALVTLFSRDFFGGEEVSLGFLPGYQNILSIGWVEGESIVWGPDKSYVSFTVRGPQWWLGKMMSFPIGIRNTSGTPLDWTEFKNLTVDSGIWHMLYWRTTAPLIMDIFRSGDTRLLPAAEGHTGTLWDQLNSIAYNTILARPLCDRYGRLFVEVDSQYLPVPDRSSIPVIQEITSEDWEGDIEIDREIVPDVSAVEVSGVAYDGSRGTPLFSRAPGTVFSLYGRVETRDQLLLENQSQANLLAGLILGSLRNEYPRVRLQLAEHHRFLDITPRQYVTLSAVIPVREITFSSKKLIPRRIEYQFQEGFFTTSLECEGETFPESAVTVLQPASPSVNIPSFPEILVPNWPLIPPISTLPPLPINPPSIILPPEERDICVTNLDSPPNGPWNLYAGGTIYNTSPWSRIVYIRGTARDPSFVYPTTYTVSGIWQRRDIEGGIGEWYDVSEDDWWDIYLVDMFGGRIAVGVHDPVTNPYIRTGYFNISAPTGFYGIEVTIRPTAPTLALGDIQESLYGHFWDAGGTISKNWGTYNNGSGIWIRVQGHWDNAYWSWTGIQVKLIPEEGHTFAGLWYLVEGEYSVSSNQMIGGVRLTQNESHDNPDIATVELNDTSGVLKGRVDEIQNSTQRDYISLRAGCWIGASGPPGQTYDGEVTWQVWPLASYKLGISTVYLSNVCPPM